MKTDTQTPPKSILALFFQLGGMVVPILLIWAWLVYSFAAQHIDSARQFTERGETTLATVVSKEYERKRTVDGEMFTLYLLDLRYETQAGEAISITQSVTVFEYNRIETGDTIDIIYLRDAPEIIEVTPGINAQRAMLLCVALAIVLALAICMTWVAARRAMDAIQARKLGTREEVALIEVRRKGLPILSRRVQLIWSESTGRAGQSMSRAKAKFGDFKPGDPLIVFHGDRRSWWAGDIGDRAP